MEQQFVHTGEDYHESSIPFIFNWKSGSQTLIEALSGSSRGVLAMNTKKYIPLSWTLILFPHRIVEQNTYTIRIWPQIHHILGNKPKLWGTELFPTLKVQESKMPFFLFESYFVRYDNILGSKIEISGQKSGKWPYLEKWANN